MTESWGPSVPFGSSEDRLFAIVRGLQDAYLHDPELESDAACREQARRMADERDRRAGELWDEEMLAVGVDGNAPTGRDAVQAMTHVLDRAEHEVVDRLVAAIPARAVHDAVHGRPAPTGPAPVPPVVTGEFWAPDLDTAQVQALWTAVGNSDGSNGDVENFAIPPEVEWTDADRRAVLEEAIGIYGVEPGEFLDLAEWPPTRASLYDPGYVFHEEGVCRRHSVEVDDPQIDNCADCADSVRFVIEKPAVWKFSTELVTRRLYFDEAGNLTTADGDSIDTAFEVRELQQDPRELRVGETSRAFG